MGGLSRIWYSSISSYAHDHGIVNEALALFVTLIQSMDEEYVAFVNERQKEQLDKDKQK